MRAADEPPPNLPASAASPDTGSPFAGFIAITIVFL
jgi:hypothetical protein